ncbi:MAG: type II toxin-antitoxin system VapC family toxin [Solirubrobacterales bacterium]|nr:type II toxin-antitoxin system VapC family toxin [Solirubrobacterales bacterium]
MVIDTSAVIAILLKEAEEDEFLELIAADPDPLISAATLVEIRMVAESRLGPGADIGIAELLAEGGVRVVAFDETQAAIAHGAWQQFGRGNSPARLNLGDCFSYALARCTDRPLLFKGEDFRKTDVASAV